MNIIRYRACSIKEKVMFSDNRVLGINEIRIMATCLKLVFVFGLMLCTGLTVSSQTVTSPQNKNSDNTVDQKMKGSSRVNPSTLAMELNIPLMNYPGRGGNSMPFGFSYSSKVWRMDDILTRAYPLPASCNKQYVTHLTPRYAERTISGWTSSISPPVIEEKIDLYDANGKPVGTEFDDVFLPDMFSSLAQNYQTFTDNTVANPSLPCGWYCAAVNYNSNCQDNPNQCGWYCSRYGYNGCYQVPNSPWCSSGPPPEPRLTYYLKRLNVRTPDGATHEFRKSDGRYPYCYGTGNPNNGPGCDQNGLDRIGTYLSVDGSGLRLQRDSSGSTLHLPNGGRYYFPETGEVMGNEVRLFIATEFTDVNGNKTTFAKTITDEGQIFLTQKDTLEREITDPLPQNFGWTVDLGVKEQDVYLPGMGEDTQDYKLIWERLKPHGCEESTVASCGDGNNDGIGDGALENQAQKLSYDTDLLCFGATETPISGTNEFLFAADGWGLRSCSSFHFQPDVNGNAVQTASRFNPIVLGGIYLPNGKSYKFKYNQYGEISKIVHPSGSFERFEYFVVTPLGKFTELAYNQTNRGVKKHEIYKAGATVPDQTFQYDVDASGDLYKITTLGSKADSGTQLVKRSERYLIKGISYGERFGFDTPLAGMVAEEQSFDDNEALRSRTLTEWTATGPVPTGEQYTPARPEAQRDGRPLKSVSVMIEGTEALATMSENVYQDPATDSGVPTDPSYFAALNVKEKRSHHYKSVSLGDAQAGSISTLAAYFSSSSLAGVSKTEYSYDPDYKARGIPSRPIRTKMFNPGNSSDILAQSELLYDQSATDPNLYPIISAGTSPTWQNPNSDLRGNVTTSRTWVKETDTWLETHAQYDNFGNLRKAWDASGDASKFVETQYSEDYQFAYPTKVITPAPAVAGPAANHGTTETSSSETTYDPNTGLVLTVKDDFGQIIRNEYNDPLLRLKKTYGENFTAPISETIYDDNALTVKVRKQIDENNWDEATTYMDSLGRTFKAVAKDSQGDVTVETHYDLFGRVDRVTSPYRAGDTVYWSKTRFDEAGRGVESYAPATLSDVTNNTNLVTLGITSFGISNVTNYVGTFLVSNDASGRKSRSITNALGQLLRVDEPTAMGGTTADDDLGSIGSPAQPTYYEYDLYGNMVQVTQGVQNRFFKYDSLGRLIRVRQPEEEINPSLQTSGNPDNNDWTAGFVYDVLGNVLTATDAKGVTIGNTYDRAGRVTTRGYYGETGTTTPTVYFFYDGKGLASQQSPNYAKGKLTNVSSDISQTRYKLFDNFGRLKEMEQRTPVDHTVETPGQTTPRISKYTYNLPGALIEEEYPSGRKVRNEFESDGDLKRVYGIATSTAAEQTYVNSFSYTASGGISRMKLGNGKWETAQFNSRQQVTQLGLGASAADAGLWKVNYQYGELNTDGSVNTNKNTGNIAKQTLTIPGTSFTQNYKYDPLYRLTEAKEFTGTSTTNPNWTQAFGYDIYGNRTSFTQSGSGLPTISAPPGVNANTNRFTSTNFAYDKNGNITSDIDSVTSQARSFVFNGDNKQIEAKNASNVPIGKYYYDGEGKRVKKVTDTETTIFVYSGGKLVAEYSTQVSQNPTISYMTGDHLGSPRIITDKAGSVKSRRDFMPFGEDIFVGVGGRTGDIGQKYSSSADDIRQKFTGYQKDTETSLDFAEARMYENRHGRFTAVDPLLASGNSSNPQTFNRYVYVGNSPLVMTDPSGMVGDYFDRNGKWLGTDKINDQQIYFATEAYVQNGKTFIYKNSIVPTTMEEVMRAMDAAVPLTRGTEREAINFFASSISDTVDDAGTGAAKGVGNFGINFWNAGTGLILRSHGGIPIPSYVPNPLAATPYTYDSPTERKFGTAVETGLTLAPSFAAAPFAASRTLSVVPDKILSPSQRALTLGVEGESAVGVTGPKERIPSFTNTAAYRIPDRITPTTVEEVKNVSRLSYTRQIKDYQLYANSVNKQLIIHARPTTCFTGPMRRLIDDGSIFVKIIP